MISDSILERITQRMNDYRDAIVSLQGAMTAIPAIAPESGGDGEWAKADMLEQWLRSEGFEVSRYNAPDPRCSKGARPNLIARLPGKDRSRTTWVMGHMDVVPPGDLSMWKHDPYTMSVDGDRVCGRGVSDNQHGIISAVFAIKCLKDEGIIPETDAAALLVADEETGSRFGVRYLLTIDGLFKSNDRYYIPDAGNEDGTMIEVAEKAKMWMKFTVLGKQGHAGSPSSGINAHRAACDLIVRLNGLYTEFAAIDPLFTSPSSFEPTKREANVESVNILPGKDVFYVDCRFLPCYSGEEIFASIRSTSDAIEHDYCVKVEIERFNTSAAIPPVSPDSGSVRDLIPAIRKIMSVEPYLKGIGGGTVAYYLRLKGFPAIVWMKEDGGAHQPNETSSVTNMIENALVFSVVMLTP